MGKPVPEKPFRIAAKRFFLTYPKCHMPNADSMLIALEEMLEEKGLVYKKLLVAEETHEDGSLHYHVAIEMDRTINIKRADYFDIDVDGCVSHPNIQSVKSMQKVLDYCVKDGKYVNKGFTLDPESQLTTLVEEAAKKFNTRQEAIKYIMAQGKDKALKWFPQVDGYLSVVQKPVTAYDAIMVYPDDFKIEPEVDFFIRGFHMMIWDTTFNGERTAQNKSLWLWGPSRLGKTVLARSMGRHWYMNSMWNAECLDDEAAYGVLDDIPWENMKFNYKGMLGMQKDVTVTDKYRKKSVYKGGKPVIVISNEMPDFTRAEAEWIGANVIVVGIMARCWEPSALPATPLTPILNTLF